MKNSPAGFSAEYPGLHHHSSRLSVFAALGAAAVFVMWTTAALAAQAKPKEPTVSADAGSCSADFLVRGRDHKPLYGAKIGVKFHYGLFGLHKASLEAYTDVNGKLRFEGLPRQPKNAFVFKVSHGGLHKTVTDSPLDTCQAQFTVVLK